MILPYSSMGSAALPYLAEHFLYLSLARSHNSISGLKDLMTWGLGHASFSSLTSEDKQGSALKHHIPSAASESQLILQQPYTLREQVPSWEVWILGDSLTISRLLLSAKESP